MSATGSWRRTVARHVRDPCPTKHNHASLLIAQNLRNGYSTQTTSSSSSGTHSKPGPSTFKNAASNPKRAKKSIHKTPKRPIALLRPSPSINNSDPNSAVLPSPRGLQIPFPQPQTRFEEGFSRRLGEWGLDDATKFLIQALQAKHTVHPTSPNRGAFKPLGVTQEFLDKVLCTLRMSAPTVYTDDPDGHWPSIPIELPNYGWLPSGGERPAPARALTQAMKLLQVVRHSGRPRPQEHYSALIKAFLARGHIEEATKLYVELVLDWNVQLASGGKLLSSFAADASDETRRAVEMISPRGDHMGLLRDMPAQVRKETSERGVLPFPQAGMLNAICKAIEAEINNFKAIRKEATEEQAKAYARFDRHGIRPGIHGNLLRSLESLRVLSTLLYHNQLPYGTTYRSYEPLLNVTSMVPRTPKYTIEVVLAKSEDKDPEASPKWMRIGEFATELREGEKAPHVFRTSLHAFTWTMLRSITGKASSGSAEPSSTSSGADHA